MSQEYQSYSEVKARLDEIVSAVDSEELSLDDALALYEEAVKLGMRTVSMIEEDAAARVEAQQAEGEEEGQQAGEEPAAETADAAPEAAPEAAFEGEANQSV